MTRADERFEGEGAGRAAWRRRVRAGAAAAALALLLAGCGGGGTPTATFDLSALPGGQTRSGAGRGQLVVSAPLATAALDSDRIVIRPAPDQVAYLSGAQWADRLPQLVLTRMVQSLENARMLAAVGRAGQGMSADWALSGEIRRFEVDVASGQAVAEITVKLVQASSGRVAGAMIARGVAAGSASSGETATQALDEALQQALQQIVGFVRARV